MPKDPLAREQEMVIQVACHEQLEEALIPRGTKSSNPASASAESANHRFLSVGASLPAMCRSGGAVACCCDCVTLGQIKLLVSASDHLFVSHTGAWSLTAKSSANHLVSDRRPFPRRI